MASNCVHCYHLPHKIMQKEVIPLLSKLETDFNTTQAGNPASSKCILTKESRRATLQTNASLRAYTEGLKSHPFKVLAKCTRNEISSSKAGVNMTLEAHVDEIMNSILTQIFPAQAKFSVAPQARHLKLVQFENLSTVAADNTEHDVSRCVRRGLL
ncbi:hypothetical protein D9757_012354 [Collybiopsis confluens]|uniref:Uncharacterized protein n=1 Tax=Collybiopsis confluens TaxID=2823264 RepID=A0A8H5G3C2_9AGAR|nr:hypothetical protein D9757_012354 [Collybiopsis confluens]